MDGNSRNFRLITATITLLLIVFGLYLLVAGFLAKQNTGLLNIKASKSSAIISISQADKQAKIVGTGTAHLRLKPGNYLLVASNSGSRTSMIASVTKKHVSSVDLDLNNTSTLQSPASINFQNLYFLLSYGLTQDQARQLENEFFEYKPAAHTVAIDASSIKTLPHSSGSGSFAVNFNVRIDTANYKATIAFTGLEAINLSLYDQNGQKAFDSTTITPTGD